MRTPISGSTGRDGGDTLGGIAVSYHDNAGILSVSLMQSIQKRQSPGPLSYPYQ